MSAGVVNSIIHDVQVAQGIHLCDEARRAIERGVMAAVRDGAKVVTDEKNYWMNKYLAPEITVNKR